MLFSSQSTETSNCWDLNYIRCCLNGCPTCSLPSSVTNVVISTLPYFTLANKSLPLAFSICKFIFLIIQTKDATHFHHYQMKSHNLTANIGMLTYNLTDIVWSHYVHNVINNYAFLNILVTDFMASWNVNIGWDLSILERGTEIVR